MLLITPLIVGVFVGIGVSFLFHRRRFMFRNILFGIVGSVVFEIIVIIFDPTSTSQGFTFISWFGSFIGASLFCYIPKWFPPVDPIN